MDKKYKTKNFEETQKLGENFAKEILSSPHKNGRSSKIVRAKLIALHGNLGGGKTTFLQGFAKGLGIKEKILSPTFVIMKKFEIPFEIPQKGVLINMRTHNHYYSGGRRCFYHFDCYRINKPEEILELGFAEIISNPKNIVVIEWPEKIKKYLPKTAIKISFKFIDENTREIIISSLK